MSEGDLKNDLGLDVAAGMYYYLNMKIKLILTVVALIIAAASVEAGSIWENWKNGPPTDPKFFIIGVGFQDPGLALEYKKAGISTYLGLWKGPTEQHLKDLQEAGMYVICEQNKVGLAHKGDKNIIAWENGVDEADNAQANGKSTPLETLKKAYETIKSNDLTRPVMGGFGCGIANDEWIGRGSGFNYDYYIKASLYFDIVGFDVYPICSIESGRNLLWYQAKGLDRLSSWAPGKPKGNAFECTFSNGKKFPPRKPSPSEVKSEIWISIIHGTNYILYFCHSWYPRLNEHALLDDPEMLSAVTKINKQIIQLAPAINSPSIKDKVEAESELPSNVTEYPIDVAVKEVDNTLYIFSAGMRSLPKKTQVKGISLSCLNDR